jgi:hypothetical protein
MEMKLLKLVLLCKEGEERVPFSPKLSFFHGEMSTGKSTVVEMVNYCLGASLVRTPAVTSEVVGVQLLLEAGGNETLIERSIDASGRVTVSWKRGEEQRLETLPLVASPDPLVGDDIYNLSDFLLRAMGVPLLKVRRSKVDADSEMHRIGFRDFYKFVYLDQDELDSSFFMLETPIRQEKSKDVLRYVLGLHSDQLAEFEIKLSDLRLKQRMIRESAKQIDDFLSHYGFNSEEAISGEIKRVQGAANEIAESLRALTPTNTPQSFVSEETRDQLLGVTKAIEEKQAAVRDTEEQLRDQQSLSAELLSLKLKVARSSVASRVLEGADFRLCPACGSQLEKPDDPNQCRLCHANIKQPAKSVELDAAVVERDLIDRIEDLDRSSKRLRRSLDRHAAELTDLSDTRAILQRKVDAAKASGESQYMQRVRALESKRGGLEERQRFLSRVVAMPNELESRRQEADKMSEEIAKVERLIEKEQEKFAAGRENVAELEQSFLRIMRAIHFPGITDKDDVHINTKTWMPYILPGGNEARAWTFGDAGSGGKKVLFKICFALALHLTAARRGLTLPKLLIIDSTMKNITPDINPDVVAHFYKEMYRLLAEELAEWQCVLVDQTYFAPGAAQELEIAQRLMKKDDPDYPRLISYYKGH